MRPDRKATPVAVAVFVLQTAGSGVAVYGIPVYIAAFLRSGTVSAAGLSLASTGFFVVGALTGPLFARLGQRRPNLVMLGAVLGGTAAITAMAVRPTGIVVIAAFSTLGAIFSGGLVVVGTIVLVRVFDGRPTAGMALATSGSSAGGILVSPVLALLLTTQAALTRSFLAIAAGFLVISCGALALGSWATARPSPVRAPVVPAGRVRLLRHWPLVVAFSLVSASQLGATSYIVATALSRDFTGARMTVSVATAAAVASRWIGSAGIRRLGLHRWTVTSFCAQAVGVALVGVAPYGWVLFLGAVLIGQSLGITILIRSQVIVELFGIDEFARKFAQFQTWTSLGSAAGPLVLGQIYSTTQDYVLAYLTLFVLNAVAVPFLLPWMRTPRPRPGEPMKSGTLTVPRYEELLRRTDAPPGSSWHVFGPGDQLGTLNFLTPQSALDGAALVRRGRVFNLDHPLNTFVPSPAGTRPPTAHHIFANNPHHRDDWLDSFYLQSTSQVDGLRHIRHPRHGFYGGVEESDIDVGTPSLGIQLLAEKGIVGRGVLLDAVRWFDSIGEPLAPNAPRGITPSDLDAMALHFGVEFRPGDILLLHTGWARHWLNCTPQERAARTGSPGLHQSEEMLAWLWDHRISVAASDNGGLESFPVDPGSGWVDPDEPPPLRGPSHNGMMHRPLIALLGLIIGELWKLDELAEDCAADGVYEFLLTAKPLNLLGGVGSPPNALAVK